MADPVARNRDTDHGSHKDHRLGAGGGPYDADTSLTASGGGHLESSFASGGGHLDSIPAGGGAHRNISLASGGGHLEQTFADEDGGSSKTRCTGGRLQTPAR